MIGGLGDEGDAGGGVKNTKMMAFIELSDDAGAKVACCEANVDDGYFGIKFINQLNGIRHITCNPADLVPVRFEEIYEHISSEQIILDDNYFCFCHAPCSARSG